MPNPENIRNKTFKERPEAINKNGRPRKIYTLLKEKGFSKDDIVTAFGEVAFYSQQEIIELAKDQSKPMIIRIIANQFIECFKKSDYKKITEIMEHIIGKPLQKIESDLTSKGNSINNNSELLESMTFEQLYKLKYGKSPD